MREKGFTFIEALVYMGLAAIFLPVAVSFVLLAINSRIRNEEVGNVEQEGVRALRTMIQAMRDGFAIEVPVFSTSSTIATIRNSPNSSDITTFSLSNSQIQIQEVSNPVRALTSNRASASNLVFTNVSHEGTPGVITIEFILTAGKYSKKFYGAGAIRR